jgi:hypothetical protein
MWRCRQLNAAQLSCILLVSFACVSWARNATSTGRLLIKYDREQKEIVLQSIKDNGYEVVADVKQAEVFAVIKPPTNTTLRQVIELVARMLMAIKFTSTMRSEVFIANHQSSTPVLPCMQQPVHLQLKQQHSTKTKSCPLYILIITYHAYSLEPCTVSITF